MAAGINCTAHQSRSPTCLLWAKLTILAVGFMLLSGQLLSGHGGDEDIDYHTGVVLRSSSPGVHNAEQHASHLAYNNEKGRLGRGGYVLHHMFSLIIRSWKVGKEESLCDFKGDEALPKHVLLWKLEECYKVLSSKNAGNGVGGINGHSGAISYLTNYRRLLRNSDDLEPFSEKKTLTSRRRANPKLNLLAHSSAITSSIAQDNNIEAAFHIDYNGPKTHPPKNN